MTSGQKLMTLSCFVALCWDGDVLPATGESNKDRRLKKILVAYLIAADMSEPRHCNSSVPSTLVSHSKADWLGMGYAWHRALVYLSLLPREMSSCSYEQSTRCDELASCFLCPLLSGDVLVNDC